VPPPGGPANMLSWQRMAGRHCLFNRGMWCPSGWNRFFTHAFRGAGSAVCHGGPDACAHARDGIVVGDARSLRERLGDVWLTPMRALNPG
jgi:hypothetical protein